MLLHSGQKFLVSALASVLRFVNQSAKKIIQSVVLLPRYGDLSSLAISEDNHTHTGHHLKSPVVTSEKHCGDRRSRGKRL